MARQPFMYEPVRKDDDRFPQKPFDPKAVTRASWEPNKPKPKPSAPYVAINRHPDSHVVPSGSRAKYKPMSYRTTNWIKRMRAVQLCLRVLEAIAAVGLFVVMAISGLIALVIGVTLGVVVVHCLYSVFHHAQRAGSRAPGSSAAYQVFSAVSDLCVLPLYAYGALAVHHKRQEWQGTTKDKPHLMNYMIPSVQYGLIAAGGLHVVSLAISLYLALMFRRIARMPPDMNPLEPTFTSPPNLHTRNKPSIATVSTEFSYEKHRDSLLFDSDSRPPSVPFMHTRQGSNISITADNVRSSFPSSKHASLPPTLLSSNHPGNPFVDLDLGDPEPKPLGPKSMSASAVDADTAQKPTSAQHQPRTAKFTETWYASDSLIGRTQKRLNAVTAVAATPAKNNAKYYTSMQQHPDLPDSPNSSPDNDSDDDDDDYTTARSASTKHCNAVASHQHIDSDYEDESKVAPAASDAQPNPLRSHPVDYDYAPDPNHYLPVDASSLRSAAKRPRTPGPFARLRASMGLTEIHPNDRRVSGSQDITDQTDIADDKQKIKPFQPRNRQSSIQPDSDFCARGKKSYTKPYGELRPETPPTMVDSLYARHNNGNRQVSTGIDYGDLGAASLGRRVLSGRAAEEGYAGLRRDGPILSICSQ